MNRIVQCVALLVAIGLLNAAASAQDLFDTSVLRTINLTFKDANWLAKLKANYVAQINIAADLEIDGQVFPDVGVRIRGNTSYTALPAGSQKFSLNIEMDWMVENQELWGYDSFNLNNGFHDPTFCREVVYNNFVAQYVPNPRATHVTVTLNGQNWGVYNCIQQVDKDMIRAYFADEDGLRIKCANNPNGPGLKYNGPNPSGYTGYEIKNNGGLANPWAPLIDVCNKVTNEPLASWPNIDNVFAIDPSIWSVVLENMLTDDDSYVHKGADFMLYRDPADGRMHLMQTDANETFTQINWSPTLNFTATSKPVLSHVLAVAELRQRYMAHLRTAKANLTWEYFEPIFTAHRKLIDEAVKADPKKLYSYALFEANFTSQVTMPYPGLAGGPIVGLQQFVNSRANFLSANTELNAKGPIISAVQASNSSPAPEDPVWITAAVAPDGSEIAKVELFYRPVAGVYLRTPMLDDGRSGDGAAGDGVYGAQLPVVAAGGQRVAFYVAATSANTHASLSFSPALAERGPFVLEYQFGFEGVRITEYMYSGPSGEFFELTNLTQDPVDLTGWSFDDDSNVPGVFSLSGAGVLAPGQSVVVTESAATNFATAWGLNGATILGSNTVANLGRNDQINIYDAQGNLVERLDYGDETFQGTIRTQNASGQACLQALGGNDIYAWVLSEAGDEYDSFVAISGEPGTPGSFKAVSCLACPADFDGDTAVDGADLGVLLANWGLPGVGDIDNNGFVDAADLGVLLSAWGTCQDDG